MPDFHQATKLAGKAIGGAHIKKNSVVLLILFAKTITPPQ